MKYQATLPNGDLALDGEGRPVLFMSEQACLEYERTHRRDEELKAQANKFLDMQDWQGDEKAKKRERTKAQRWIHAWLMHDARQRPERYRDVTPEANDAEPTTGETYDNAADLIASLPAADEATG